MDIQKFEALFGQKMRSNKDKRLLAIEEYLAFNHDIEISFENDTERCLAFILQMIREETEISDVVLGDIADIIMERYSAGQPYAVSELETELNLEQIKKLLETLLLKDCSYENLIFSDCHEVTIDNITEIVEFKCRYTEFYVDPRTGDLGREIQSGTIHVMFDLKNKLYITSMVGYNKIINKLIDLIKHNFHPQINIKPYYLQQNIRYIKNAATSDFASLTLLVINLIFKKFNDMGYIVQSVDSLSFNNENAPRIKNAKLTGTDLFKDPDVVERIYSADKITKFTVNIMKMIGGNAALLTDLTIDFRGMIKFIFDNQNERTFTVSQACVDLFNGINELMDDEHTIEIGQTLLKENMQRLAFDTRPQFNAFMYTLKNELTDLLPDKAEEVKNFFQSTYNVSD
ncbi:hypothetical protein COL05_16760 [Bacillus sp. AFS059628]|uniref:hypothetical protein n=1 Tax=Bacillus TaxID=1386 RepID=UPI000BF6EFED|nr:MULTISPECIES: hypothetical protein [Bacillus]PER93731.1 hypothetical protein CN500_21465 [Bacillus cereus]PFV79491.1 hypothetical protein COL05_16760 [Bacillus sp. AFS059628]